MGSGSKSTESNRIQTPACVKHFSPGQHINRGNQEILEFVCTFDQAVMPFLFYYTFKLWICEFFLLLVIFWWSFGPGKCEGMDFWFLYHNYISNWAPLARSTIRQSEPPSPDFLLLNRGERDFIQLARQKSTTKRDSLARFVSLIFFMNQSL